MYFDMSRNSTALNKHLRSIEFFKRIFKVVEFLLISISTHE